MKYEQVTRVHEPLLPAEAYQHLNEFNELEVKAGLAMRAGSWARYEHLKALAEMAWKRFRQISEEQS